MDWVRLAQEAKHGDEEAGAKLSAELKRAGFSKPERDMEAEMYLWNRLGPNSIKESTDHTVLVHLKDGRCFSVHLTTDPAYCEFLWVREGNSYSPYFEEDSHFGDPYVKVRAFKRMKVWGEPSRVRDCGPTPTEEYFGPWFEYFEE